jgi:hypothetical protein
MDAVVLACTMQIDDVPGKIKRDLQSICQGGASVDRVVYFTVSPVAVAKRHDLIGHARDEHGLSLDIWDALALATNLAEPGLFYLAEQYLNVPADMAPPPVEEDRSPQWYRELRSRWRLKGVHFASYAELVDLRQGLRYATFHDEARADIADWLSYARALLAAAHNSDVTLRAQYEIAVATLRGTNTLRPADDLVRAFFDTVLQSVTDHGLIEDALVLDQYCAGAFVRGLTNITGDEIVRWQAELLGKVQSLLDERPYPNTRAHLLALSARLRLFPVIPSEGGTEGESLQSPAEGTRQVLDAIEADETVTIAPAPGFVDLDGGMADLKALCRHLPEAPLFPVDRLADVFDLIAPALADHPDYRTVRDALDDAVEALAGHAARADRARNRGMAFLAAGRLRQALNEIHEAKVNWWHGDTIRGAILSMLLLSDIYARLRLPLAAKNYALQAVVVASSTRQDDLNRYIAHGMLAAARASFQAGSWMTAVFAAKATTAGFRAFVEDPWDHERHPELWYLLVDLANVRRVAQAHRPGLARTVQAALEDVGIAEIIDGLLDGSEDKGEWSEDQIARSADAEGIGRPFSDVGPVRIYAWRALGMVWRIRCANERRAGYAAERFAAAAQIVVAELADHDAVLLPGRVEVEVRPDGTELAPGAERVEQVPNNDASSWIVHLSQANPDDVDTFHQELTGALISILHTVSLLPIDRFMTVINATFQRGLFHKLAIGRPFDEAVEYFPEFSQPPTITTPDRPFGATIPIEIAASPELGPPTTPGPGYDPEKALEAVRRRYAVTPQIVRFTLPRLRADAGFRTVVTILREDGWLDWHVLNAVASVVSNERLRRSRLVLPPRNRADAEAARRLQFRPEEPNDFQLPPRAFNEEALRVQLKTSALATLIGFGLTPNQQTPDFTAIFAVLGQRYGYWTDDVDHEDFFVKNP